MRVFVLNAEASTFYEDKTVDEEEEIDTFLSEILDGKVAAQYDTVPNRYYRKFVRYLPWSALGLVGIIVALYFLVRFLFFFDDEDDEEEEEDDDEEEEDAPNDDASKKDD